MRRYSWIEEAENRPINYTMLDLYAQHNPNVPDGLFKCRIENEGKDRKNESFSFKWLIENITEISSKYRAVYIASTKGKGRIILVAIVVIIELRNWYEEI